MRHRMILPTTPGRARMLALAAVLVAVMVAGMVVITTLASAAGPTTSPDTTAAYTLVSRGSGKALDVPAFSTADGTTLVQWSRTGGRNQQFRFVTAGGGYYRVQSVSSGKVLDDKSYNRAEGTPVIQSGDHDGTNQQWRIAVSGSSIRLINRASGLAMDVAGTANGATVAQHADRDAANQQWTLVQVGAATGPIATTTPAPPVTTTPAPPSATTGPSTTTPPPPVTIPPVTAPPAPPAGGGSTGPLWVNPDNPAARQVRTWQASGRAADAQILNRIATQPMASWVTGGSPAQVTTSVDGTADRAQAAHAEAVFVAYDIPGRDCGSYSAGGAGDQAQYQQWVQGFAAGLGGRKAVVILEPDAIPQQLGGCTPGTTRYTELADAVTTLENAGADVYLDAGHPGWVSDIAKLAAALTSAGVKKAAGFSINVSNFTPTAQDIAYGKQISAALGGAHFVIDTSRNGAINPPAVTSGPAWCNPPGRKIGPAPTTATGDPLVDAYLWIKTPGESDGSCRPGEASAGGWMPEYALALAS